MIDWRDFRAETMIEATVRFARSEANSTYPGLGFLQWMEGRMNAVALLLSGTERGLDAMGAENEIKFLTTYAKRHGKFL